MFPAMAYAVVFVLARIYYMKREAMTEEKPTVMED